MIRGSGFFRASLSSRLELELVSALVFCAAVFFSSLQLQAQSENGIHGTVTDASGAVIAGAKVTITNNSTGVVSSAVTSSEGDFTVVGLIPGHYTVAVDVAGWGAATMARVTGCWC